MKLIEKVEIFKVGDVIDSSGGANSYGIEDLQELAETYNETIHEAPIVISHENDSAWHKKLSSKSQLANGWVKKLYVENSSLYCDMEVDDFTYDAIKDGKLKKRSLAHYTRSAKNNPVEGKLYLRHLALLGAEPPAVKGLADIKIYKESNMKDNLLEKNSQEWLAFALIDEGNGFNGTIVSFNPEPSQENNWLYNKEAEEFSGQFIDDQDQIFDFTIEKDGEDWISTIAMAKEEEAEEEVTVEEEEEATVEEMAETLGETAEQMAEADGETKKLYAQIEAMNAKLAEYEEERKKAKEAEVKSYCESMYDRGLVNSDTITKDVLFTIIMALEEKASSLMYSDGNDNNIPVAKGIRMIFDNIPERKQFSDAVYARAGQTNIAKPMGRKDGTAESNKLYGEIVQFMEAEGIKNFAEGYRKYKQVK